MKQPSRILLTVLFILGTAVPVFGQRGTGQFYGVARAGIVPDIVSLEGNLVNIEIGPCESTTGWSPVGTHLIVRSEDGRVLNIHLGPESYFDNLIRDLKPGDPVRAEAFRTPRLAEDSYIATTLMLEGRTIRLRDASLAPSWSYGRGNRPGRGAGWGQDWGRAGRRYRW